MAAGKTASRWTTVVVNPCMVESLRPSLFNTCLCTLRNRIITCEDEHWQCTEICGRCTKRTKHVYVYQRPVTETMLQVLSEKKKKGFDLAHKYHLGVNFDFFLARSTKAVYVRLT